jgi:hypothetical protein
MKKLVAAAVFCFVVCQQDLKGNGAISVPTPAMRACTVIETDASTSLIECGSTYFVQPAGKSAVELSFGGSPVVDGEFDTDGGHWGPIAAKRTETGYEVAWKAVGADEYTVWYTDASGNCLSSPLVSASGSSAAMESLEASFRLDLNGDGVIGVNRRLRDQPEFVYEGTDSSGAQLYDVTWNKSGSHSFAVRVLTPTRPSTTTRTASYSTCLSNPVLPSQDTAAASMNLPNSVWKTSTTQQLLSLYSHCTPGTLITQTMKLSIMKLSQPLF